MFFFGAKPIQNFFPPIPTPNLVSKPYLNGIYQTGINQIALTEFYITFSTEPPCRPGKSSLPEEYQYYLVTVLLDSSASMLGQEPLGVYSFCDRPTDGVSVGFMYGQRDVFPGPEIYFYRAKPNLEVDSSFRIIKPDGSIPPNQISAQPLLVTEKGDHLFFNMKTNPVGVLDTSFRFKASPSSIAEPDTSHLYVAGGFQLYGNQIAPYLVRIHHQTSTVTALGKERKNSQVDLYPNPVEEQINLGGWKPGMILSITTIEGRKLFEGPVEKQFPASLLGLAKGLYFWTVTEKGIVSGGGRLIR